MKFGLESSLVRTGGEMMSRAEAWPKGVVQFVTHVLDGRTTFDWAAT